MVPLSEIEASLVDGLADQICAGLNREAIDLTGLSNAFLLQREDLMQALADRVNVLSKNRLALLEVTPDLFTRRIRGAAIYIASHPAELTEDEVLGMIGWKAPNVQIELLIIGPYHPGIILDTPRGVPA